MVDVERQAAMFSVAGDTRDNIPVGDHEGYVEWITVYLHGQPRRQMSKCMLHIERSRFPEFFNPKNSMTSIAVNVVSDVNARRIHVSLI
jgi:hypothetical protein